MVLPPPSTWPSPQGAAWEYREGAQGAPKWAGPNLSTRATPQDTGSAHVGSRAGRGEGRQHPLPTPWVMSRCLPPCCCVRAAVPSCAWSRNGHWGQGWRGRQGARKATSQGTGAQAQMGRPRPEATSQGTGAQAQTGRPRPSLTAGQTPRCIHAHVRQHLAEAKTKLKETPAPLAGSAGTPCVGALQLASAHSSRAGAQRLCGDTARGSVSGWRWVPGLSSLTTAPWLASEPGFDVRPRGAT